MALKDRLRCLERAAEGPVVVIPQQDGPSPRRFPQSQFADAFLDAFDRSLGRKGLAGEAEPAELGEHPIATAARNSSDPAWRESGYWANKPEHEVADLSE